jgi:hypothetical protein
LLIGWAVHMCVAVQRGRCCSDAQPNTQNTRTSTPPLHSHFVN